MSIAKQLRPDLREMIDIPLPEKDEMLQKLDEVETDKSIGEKIHPFIINFLAGKKMPVRKIVAYIMFARLQCTTDYTTALAPAEIRKISETDVTKYIKAFITDETLQEDAMEIYNAIIE